MKKLIQIIAIVISISVTTLSFAEESIMLVFDASGSMWSKSSNGSRLDTAKTAVNHLLDRIPSSTGVGLTVYGHRRKGDCSDIQVYPSSLSRGQIKDSIQSLSAKGRTPLGSAIKKAADRLSEEDKSSRIIALTDGIETCGVDLCALGQDLKNKGIGLTIDVVAFELGSNEDVASLRCLSDYTGGTFYRAEGFSGLKTVFDTISRTTSSETAEKIEATQIEHPAKAEIGDKIKIKVNANLVADKIYMLTVTRITAPSSTYTEGASETLQVGNISGSGENLKVLRLNRHTLKPGSHEVRVVDMMDNRIVVKSHIQLYNLGELSDTKDEIINKTKISTRTANSFAKGRILLKGMDKAGVNRFYNFSVKGSGNMGAVNGYYSVFFVPSGYPIDTAPAGTKKSTIVFNNTNTQKLSTILTPKTAGMYELRITKKSEDRVIAKLMVEIN